MYATNNNNESTLKNVKSTVSNMQNEAANTVDGMKGDLRETANDAGRKVRGFLNNATDEVSHMSETVTSEIRNNPMQSTLIALGVGYVLGVLLRR